MMLHSGKKDSTAGARYTHFQFRVVPACRGTRLRSPCRRASVGPVKAGRYIVVKAR